MKRIFCITGLGADERVFQHLKIEGIELVPIKWPPITANENMHSYARKIAEQINDEHPIIIGLSFGGMLAIEVSKIIPVNKIFLISSAKTRNELGYNTEFWKFVVNKNLVPFSLYKLVAPLLRYRLGIDTKEEKNLVIDLIKKLDLLFMKQAIKMIVNWDNFEAKENIIQIHGTRDRIIRPAKINPTHWIEGGGHLMIYNKANIISKLIEQYLP